jgi:O-antigen ligase
MPQLILLTFLIFAAWMLRRDTARREDISSATWIPTLWLGIMASRPLSAWAGVGGSEDTLDGSPVDRLFYLVMILAALFVLSRRKLNWGWLITNNWHLFLFYGFLLVSVIWANSPFSSFKRWFKEFGNVFVALVILTEVNPLQALRTVFVRCAYFLIPLSLIFVRWFPDMGRRYNRHSGMMEAVGVTSQKNALGTLIMVCLLMLLWDWLERSRSNNRPLEKLDRYYTTAVGAIGIWLITLCDSKTSIVTLAIATLIVLSINMPVFRQRINSYGLYALIGAGLFFMLDREFGIMDSIFQSLGRDTTMTGRTDVWRELLAVGTDPLLGTGFMSFWDDQYYRSKLPDWIAFSAHNGYLEVYLAGGVVGVIMLGVMLLGASWRINRALADGTSYSVVRFAILVMMLLHNIAESSFGCMSHLGLMFLVAIFGVARPEQSYTDAGFTSLASSDAPPLPENTEGLKLGPNVV